MNIQVSPLALWPSVALAEVSDKIILPPTMGVYALVLGVAALVLNRLWPRFSPIVAIVTILLSAQGVAVVFDDFVGPAAVAEQGASYSYIAFGTVTVVVLANIAGAYWGYRARAKAV
jgi:predicted tellurium resistance membrane protein TerC